MLPPLSAVCRRSASASSRRSALLLFYAFGIPLGSGASYAYPPG
jgi:hypothetical protein